MNTEKRPTRPDAIGGLGLRLVAPAAIGTTTARAATAAVAAAGAAATAVTTTAAGPAAAAAHAAEAVRAVNGAIAARLERNFCLLATVRTNGRIHLPLATVAAAAAVAAPTAIATAGIARGLPGCAARRTAARGAETLRLVKLLLALGKRELRAAIRASEGLICHVSLTNSWC